MKVAVLGGGGFRAPTIHAGLLSRAQRLPVAELWLYDVEPLRLDRIASVLRGQAEEAGGGPAVRVTTDLAAALDAVGNATTASPAAAGREAGR